MFDRTSVNRGLHISSHMQVSFSLYIFLGLGQLCHIAGQFSTGYGKEGSCLKWWIIGKFYIANHQFLKQQLVWPRIYLPCYTCRF